MKVTKATILLRAAQTDMIILETDLPSTMPLVYTDAASFRAEATKGHGIQYVKDNFPGVPTVVIDTKALEKGTAT